MSRPLSKQMAAAERVARKPETKSRKMKNVIRYITGQSPTKCASLPTGKPSK